MKKLNLRNKVVALTVISALLINPLTSTRAIADEKESPFSVDSSVGFYSSYMT